MHCHAKFYLRWLVAILANLLLVCICDTSHHGMPSPLLQQCAQVWGNRVHLLRSRSHCVLVLSLPWLLHRLPGWQTRQLLQVVLIRVEFEESQVP